MKTILPSLAALAALLLLPSCQDFFRQEADGKLIITLEAPRPAATRAGTDLPDVGTFLLSVTNASGGTIYEGPYAQSPDEMSIPAGSYTISAVSTLFEAPAFDTPQWGDTQVVTVPSGGSVAVDLSCSQLNSGVRLDIDESFRRAFPGGILNLEGEDGSLLYGYAETRTAFFRPGPITLRLDQGGFTQTLFTRSLQAREILTVRVSANVETKSGGISIQLDTARNWLTDNFVLGGPGAGKITDAYDVAAARLHPGEKEVWVWGYIVGVATNTRKVSFTAPFTKNTNLVLGEKAASTELDYCLSVELPSGKLREALNLVDHPELLGRKVYLKGNLESAYYGIPGLKAPSEYQLQ